MARAAPPSRVAGPGRGLFSKKHPPPCPWGGGSSVFLEANFDTTGVGGGAQGHVGSPLDCPLHSHTHPIPRGTASVPVARRASNAPQNTVSEWQRHGAPQVLWQARRLSSGGSGVGPSRPTQITNRRFWAWVSTRTRTAPDSPRRALDSAQHELGVRGTSLDARRRRCTGEDAGSHDGGSLQRRDSPAWSRGGDTPAPWAS